MKPAHVLVAVIFGGLLPVGGQSLPPQKAPEILRTSTDTNLLRWHGHQGRSYFLQVSDPSKHLEKWLWMPVIIAGADAEISQEVQTTGNKGFYRICYTDQVPGAGETLETADFDQDGLSNINEIRPPNGLATHPLNPDTDADGLKDGWEVSHAFNPHDSSDAAGDKDSDGLTNLQEYQWGANPTNPDTDGDGALDGDEKDGNTNLKDPESAPQEGWIVLTGDYPKEERKALKRTVTIPKGQTRLVMVVLHSDEYPEYTEYNSEFDDLLEWKITPTGGTEIAGQADVNDKHADWQLAESNGTAIKNFYPAHIEKVSSLTAPPEKDLTVTLELAATNISDAEKPSTVMVGLLPVDLILDNNNIAYKPDSEALGVSNYVTTNELPADSQFGDVNADPENFRLQARMPPGSTANTVQMRLQVTGSSSVTYNYTLDKKDGDLFRGRFLRLVTDASDDAASGAGANSDTNNQTIRVKLGDKIKVSYEVASGSRVEQEIQVGRPSGEDNNEAGKPRKHDIRELNLNVVVFNNNAGAACVTQAQVDEAISDADERLAQAGIKVNASITLGTAMPPDLADGFSGASGVMTIPTADEMAVIASKDGSVNTIDVFFVETMLTDGGRGGAWPIARNGTSPPDPKYNNWIVMASQTPGNFPNTLPHEIMHILLNSPHRADPNTAVFKGGTSPNKDVGGTKRIGPYPDASSAGVGQDDTTTIRGKAETLP